jgi:hypothetical protein
MLYNMVDVDSKMYLSKRFMGSNNIEEADNVFALKSLISKQRHGLT